MTPNPPANDLEIARLYRRHLTMVRNRGLRLLGDVSAAEDVAQEVFVTFLSKSRAGLSADNASALLYRMTTNRALNLLRDGKRRRELLDANTQAAATVTPEAERRIDLRRALAELPLELATIATYYYVDGMEQAEIAELLTMNRRTVSRRLDGFRTQAQRLLTQGARV